MRLVPQLIVRIGSDIRLAMILLIMLTLCILLMAFAPWQQTVRGAGYVMAYAPRERQQTLEATIEGRIDSLFAPSRPHYLIDTINELPEVIADINQRLARGEMPQSS